ncbi:MAG: PHP domain-containing protein [Anaerolineales bacterium]
MMTNLSILTDLHTHSIYSPDGQHTPDAMFQQGLELGLEAMAITEHAEWHKGDHGFPRVEEYFDAMMAARNKFTPLGLSVYTGVELGNPHTYAQQAHRLLNEFPFDIVIGSVHWLYEVNIHDAVVFQGRDLNTVYANYFYEAQRLCEEFPIDILAHFDRIFWRATIMGLPFYPQQLERPIRSMLATVARRGIALELNTRHLTLTPVWRENLATMLGWYKEEGGRGVVVNSDAHRTQQIGLNFNVAEALLTQTGLVAVTPAHLGEVTLA